MRNRGKVRNNYFLVISSLSTLIVSCAMNYVPKRVSKMKLKKVCLLQRKNIALLVDFITLYVLIGNKKNIKSDVIWLKYKKLSN
jgi:hypothetical protein